MRDQALVTARTDSSWMTRPSRSRPTRPSTPIPIEASVASPDPAHHREQLFASADPRTSVAKVAGGSLEHRDVPAGVPQQMGGEQPADRSADHQCAWSSQCPLRHFLSAMMKVPPSADKRVDASVAF
jgi:hypothetical protein